MFDSIKERGYAEEEIDQLFRHFFSSFSQTANNFETIAVYLRVARQTVCLKFTNKYLANLLTRALLHIQTDLTPNPDLTICVWDTKSTNQNLPPFLSQFNQFINANPNAGLRAIRGDVPFLTNKKIRTALMGNSSLTMANIPEKLCVHWVSGADEIPYHELGASLRVPLNFMFNGFSRQLLHGGAVGNEKGGVFLGGIGGSGKSTTALNCLLSSSIFYAGDDYVLVESDNSPTAYSLYNSAKVKSFNDLERFSKLRSLIANENGVKINQEKPMLFLNEHLPQKLIAELSLKAIVFPKFMTGEKIRIQPISQQRVFREITTSTVRQTPGNDQTTIAMIGKFIKKLPAFELVFGENQTDLTKYISDIIEENS